MKGVRKLFVIPVLFVLLISASIASEAGETPEQIPPETEQQQDVGTQEQTPPPDAEEKFGNEVIPEGCTRVSTESGMVQMDCAFDRGGFEEFDVKEEMNKCEGRFEMIDGSPSCIEKGVAGFANTECPSSDELNLLSQNCVGRIENFVDESGCNARMCINEEFKEDYEKKVREKYDNELQFRAIECNKNGGRFTLIKGEATCIERTEEIVRIKENLGTISQSDIEKAGNKLDKLEEGLQKIVQKFEINEGEVFDEAEKRLEGVQDRVEEIQAKLSYNDNLTQEERVEILVEVQNIQKVISDIRLGIVEGEMPTEEKTHERMFEEYNKFYGGPFATKEELAAFVEKEKSASEIIRNCDKYEEVKSFVPPDPAGMVVLVELKATSDGCQMTIKMVNGKTATYSLPISVYQTFKGPKDLVKDEIVCSGEACSQMKQMMQASHGEGIDVEGEACMESCIRAGCTGGTFECMLQKKENCEETCGMIKQPAAENAEQQCMIDCVGPGVMCQPGQGGEQNPACQACAQQCASQYYSGPCLSQEEGMKKRTACESQCAHCYGQPVMGDSEEGYECMVDFECKDASAQFGDNPGTGPDSYSPAGTGGAVSNENIFSRVINWFKSLFKKKSVGEVSSGNSPEDIASDLNAINSDLNNIGSDLD